MASDGGGEKEGRMQNSSIQSVKNMNYMTVLV